MKLGRMRGNALGFPPPCPIDAKHSKQPPRVVVMASGKVLGTTTPFSSSERLFGLGESTQTAQASRSRRLGEVIFVLAPRCQEHVGLLTLCSTNMLGVLRGSGDYKRVP